MEKEYILNFHICKYISHYYHKFVNWLWYGEEIINRVVKNDKISRRCFLILRIISFILALEGLLFFLIFYSIEDGFLRQLSYLTVMGAVFTFITFGLFLWEHFYEYKFNQGGEKISPTWHLSHIFSETWTTIEIPITLVYWAVLYPGYYDEMDTTKHLITIQVHALLMIYLLIDFFFNRIEWKLRHFSLVMFICTCYFIINIIYANCSTGHLLPL